MASIIETVIEYTPEMLESWRDGDKSLAPDFARHVPILRSQPAYHFVEMLTLRHFSMLGWRGYSFYAIGPQYPGSDRRREGRAKLRELVPPAALQNLLDMRSDLHTRQTGVGEPDLFLYRPTDGAFRFVEVKKDRDRMSGAQLLCLAQIKKALHCAVDVVYARERGSARVPRVYELPEL